MMYYIKHNAAILILDSMAVAASTGGVCLHGDGGGKGRDCLV